MKPKTPAIPARITVTDLASTIGCEVGSLQTELESRGQPSGPDEVLDSHLAVALARSQGRDIEVEARDLALEELYQLESRGGDHNEQMEAQTRVERLVAGVMAESESLDHSIEEASKHWSVARMPMIDRTILRLALWELHHEPDVPTAVIVSEAVRLANTYSTGKSGAFINGVLSTLAKGVRS